MKSYKNNLIILDIMLYYSMGYFIVVITWDFVSYNQMLKIDVGYDKFVGGKDFVRDKR